MRNIKFTIIVPTRERADVLGPCLKTIVAQNYDNFEIIVSDNASTDNTEEVVRSFRDSRIRYINPGKRLSMSHHWEFALSHVTEGWVNFLGDDDGLIPGAINRAADVIGLTNARAIRSNFCTYTWPGIASCCTGRLGIPLRQGSEVRDCDLWLRRLLAGDAWYTELPVVYHTGFAEVAVLKEIRSRMGAVFSSCNPDVYSGIAVASLLSSYVFLQEPLAVSGVSKHSTGRSYMQHSTGQRGTPISAFTSEGNIPLHPDLAIGADQPYPKSTHLLIYDSYLHSAPLRQKPMTSPQEQLDIALTMSADREALRSWAQAFAQRHSLDLNAAWSKADKARPAWQRKQRWQVLKNEPWIARVGSASRPIMDVFEATLEAARILNNRPSPVANIARSSVRAAEKLLGRHVRTA